MVIRVQLRSLLRGLLTSSRLIYGQLVIYLHKDRKQLLHRPHLTCRLSPNGQLLHAVSKDCSWYKLIVPASRQRPYYSAERRARHSRHLSAALFTCQTTITPVAVRAQLITVRVMSVNGRVTPEALTGRTCQYHRFKLTIRPIVCVQLTLLA